MIKQGVIHLREPGLGKHHRIVKEYCLVWVVTPPYLIERASLPNKAQKVIRIKLYLAVLICIYQHESPRMWKTDAKFSLRHFPETNKTKSISLTCDWDGLVFLFRSSRVIGDTVVRCVTGQSLPLSVHTQNPTMGVLVYLRTDLKWMHEIDLFFLLVKHC